MKKLQEKINTILTKNILSNDDKEFLKTICYHNDSYVAMGGEIFFKKNIVLHGISRDGIASWDCNGDIIKVHVAINQKLKNLWVDKAEEYAKTLRK